VTRDGALTRRDLLIGGSCLTGAALGASSLVWRKPPPLPPGGLAALIPRAVGGWQPIDTGDIVLADLEGENPYDDLLVRHYRTASLLPVTLLLAYGGAQRGDLQLHRPEGCYPGAGFTLGAREPIALRFSCAAPVPAQLIAARSPLRSEELLYWTRIGSAFPTNFVAQRWAVVRENLTGRVPDGILVRLSAPGSNRVLALASFEALLDALLATASPAARRILLGDVPCTVRSGHPPKTGRA